MKKSSTSRQVQIFDALVGGIGRGISWLLGSGGDKDRTNRADRPDSMVTREEIAARWAEVDELITLGGPARLKQALIEADKLLDLVLGELGYQGNLGEKLKAAQSRISPAVYQAAWQAHKLRNRVVHEQGEVLGHQLTSAVDQLKLAIRELMR